MNPLHSSLLAVAALAGLSATPAVAQTATMPPQTSVYNGQCRGYFFTAPVAFTITGVRVNQQTGVNNAFQNFAIVRFDGGSPPQWTATTNAFTQLVLRFDLDASAFQAVNVPVAAGDIIGVFGNTAPAAGWNFGFHSLAGQTIASMTTTIAGHPVHLRRAAMQAHLGLAGSSQGMHDIYFENSPMARIEFTYSVTNGTLGTRYCSPPVLNSLAHPGTLFVTGSAVASQNDVTLHASNLPLNAFGFFLCSRTQAQIAQPGGSLGVLCVGGSIGRYVGPGQVKNGGTGGSFRLDIDLAAMPQPSQPVAAAPGETWNFTAWYRDSVGGATVSNFTDAVGVTFQ
jgi:hypothetical protein